MHNNDQDISATKTARTRYDDQVSPFTPQEWMMLLQLRRRYREGSDLLSVQELERLRFMRWLYTTNQIER
jgi:hypothetical protein